MSAAGNHSGQVDEQPLSLCEAEATIFSRFIYALAGRKLLSTAIGAIEPHWIQATLSNE